MYLEKYASVLYTPTFNAHVASNSNTYLKHTRLPQRVWQRLKRDLPLALTGQLFCQKRALPAKAKKILYIYLGTPQLGDSIMDLSPRTLWTQRGLKVDLFTHSNIVKFYEDDPSFSRVLCDEESLAKNYDFIVLQSYSWKCLKLKWQYFFSTPFLSLYGHYYGPEFNRSTFATHSWARALGLSDQQLIRSVKPVFNLNLDHNLKIRKKGTIALAIGGVVSWRTYDQWIEVVGQLRRTFPGYKWVLLGAENGLQRAVEVMTYFQKIGQVHLVENLVAKLSLPQVFHELQQVTLLVTADGGLLHLAKAAKAPMVALMAGPIHPMMRFERFDLASVIHAPTSVNEIEASKVATASTAALEFSLNSLRIEYLGQEPDCK